MRLRQRYGTLVDAGTQSMAWRPARIVDDVLGLRGAPPYPAYLERRYRPMFLADASGDDAALAARSMKPEEVAAALAEMEISGRIPIALYRELADLTDEELRARAEQALQQRESQTPEQVEQMDAVIEDFRCFVRFVAPDSPLDPRWTDAFWKPAFEAFPHLAARFGEAAEQATRGRLDPRLAADISRVTWLADGELEVPDLPALAAWCLAELLRQHGPLALDSCRMCGLPWLGERGAKYCKRPAPDHLATCQAVAAQSRFRKANPAYHRERKRLYERVRRGTLKREDYESWRRGNSPGIEGQDWQRLETWDLATKEERSIRSRASVERRRAG